MISQVALFCMISVVAAYVVPEYSSPDYEPKVYDEPPQPYSFGFNTKDEYGATINQHETGDELGNKKGSYGYTDGYGVYRQVDYVADEHGFRATVKTNEPGTDNQNPADAEILSEASPVAYEKSPAVAAVDPVYAKPAAVVAPVYSHPAAPAYAESVSGVQGHGPTPVYDAVYAPAPVHGPAPVYDAVHAPAPVYGPAPAYDAAHVPAQVGYGPAPVYDASVHAPAPVYSPAQVYDSAPVGYAHGSPVHGSAPFYAPGPVAEHPSGPVYGSVRAPVYAGPSYDQLLDRANQVNGHSSEYEPEAVENYNSY